MYLCICVCMVCIYVCMYACMYVCMDLCMYLHEYVSMYVCICVCFLYQVCVYVCTVHILHHRNQSYISAQITRIYIYMDHAIFGTEWACILRVPQPLHSIYIHQPMTTIPASELLSIRLAVFTLPYKHGHLRNCQNKKHTSKSFRLSTMWMRALTVNVRAMVAQANICNAAHINYIHTHIQLWIWYMRVHEYVTIHHGCMRAIYMCSRWPE